MREKTNFGGSFTFAGTSLTVNRIGYGAMQLAGRDGDKRVWGPPRDIPGAIAVLARGGRVGREPHRYQRLLRSACNQSDH